MTKLEKKQLRGFVNGLSEEQAREQLYLAYIHMDRCARMMAGEDGIEPVDMMENGFDTDLELFYTIREYRDRVQHLVMSSLGLEHDTSMSEEDEDEDEDVEEPTEEEKKEEDDNNACPASFGPDAIYSCYDQYIAESLDALMDAVSKLLDQKEEGQAKKKGGSK